MIDARWILETGEIFLLTLGAGFLTWGVCYPWFLYRAERKEHT